MLRRVHLHGPFKAFHDGPIEVEAATPWEAIEAVTNQIKGFEPDPVIGRKKIQVAGYRTVSELKTADDTVDLHLMPAMLFGKNGGLIQTIIGVTMLVVVAAALIVAGPGATLTLLGQMVLSAGISLTAGGLMQLLTPQPHAQNAEARSKYLPTTQNTVALDTTIPLLYGRFRCGGQIMSLEVVSKSTPTS